MLPSQAPKHPKQRSVLGPSGLTVSLTVTGDMEVVEGEEIEIQ
jgi:hypothetical protein